MRKAGIQFEAIMSVSPELTGKASTLSGRYREENGTTFTNFPVGFTEISDGVYSSPLTISTAGNYLVIIESTDPLISDSVGWVPVTGATLDDVKALIDTAQASLNTIEGKVDVLDDAIIASIASTATSIDNQLAEVKALISDVDDPAIISLRELLIDIQNAGSSRDSVIAALTSYTDDLEAMVRGDEFLADGITANPFYGKTSADVYDALTAGISTLHGAITDAQAAVVADAHTTRDAIVAKIDAIKLVVDANADALADETTGLAALKAGLDQIITNTAGGTQSIIDMLSNATYGLSAIKTAIMDKLGTIEGKVDTINSKILSTYSSRLVM